MRSILTILMVLLTTATLAAATEPRLSLWFGNGRRDPYNFDIWETWEVPIEGQTRGAAFDDDGYVWLQSKPFYGEPYYYYEIDFEGNIITSFEAPDVFGPSYGIDVDGDYLWIACDDYVYHVTKTGSVVSPSPFYIGGGIHDLGWDGEYLWVVTNGADFWRARCYDVETGECVDWFYVGDSFFETETYSIGTDGTYIYTIGWERLHDSRSYIYKYSKTGTLLDHVYTLVDGWHAKVAYWEEEITDVKQGSLGRIKAIYRR